MKAGQEKVEDGSDQVLMTAAANALETLRRLKFRARTPFPSGSGDARAWADWAADPAATSPDCEEIAEAVRDLALVADAYDILASAETAPERLRLAAMALTVMPLGAAKWRQKLGRRMGTGYGEDDAPLVAEIKRRSACGESKRAVAMELAHAAAGGGTLESKATRLLRAERGGEK